MLIPKLLLDEINSARTNPNGYAEKVTTYKGYFNKEYLKRPDGKKIKTQEGAEAYEEAIKYLKARKPVGPLRASKALTKICEDLMNAVQNCDPGALDSHIDMSQVIKKYGSFEGDFSRLMEFGGETPEQVVINLIVCDGDRSRTQRNQLLDKTYKVVGIVSADHEEFTKCTIITLTHKFDYEADPDDVENY